MTDLLLLFSAACFALALGIVMAIQGVALMGRLVLRRAGRTSQVDRRRGLRAVPPSAPRGRRPPRHTHLFDQDSELRRAS